MEKRNIFLYEENKLKEVIEIINKQNLKFYSGKFE